MKRHFYCEREQQPMGEVRCDGCNALLCVEPYYKRETSRQYEGQNSGEHECRTCRSKRERAYDEWVTSPFYHPDA